jgi:hypothetical protein
MKFKRYFFLLSTLSLFLTVGLLSSCSIIEPAAPLPTYIQIDSFHVTSNLAISGSSANKIHDAWVIVDNEYLGTFPVPGKFPIADGGTHSITLYAGIVEDGISSLRTAYVKYYSFDTTMSMNVGETYTVVPQIGYNSANSYPNMEDFEDASLDLVSTSAGNTPVTIITPPDPDVFEGNSGKVTLADTNTVLEIASVTPFTLPLNTLTYVELNFKSDIDFTVGAYITAGSVYKQDLLNIRASSVWKKIYININDLGGVVSNATAYKIYIHAEKPSTVPSANLFLDNFKVVY